MTNKIYYYLLIFILPFSCIAQNLVPNPGFEDTLGCPSGFGDINKAIGWINFGISPDYWHFCAGSCWNACYGTPQNMYGFQEPLSGNAYAGIGLYIETQSYREYLGVKLNSPLEIGVEYHVSAFVSQAFWPPNTLSTNNFGFTFYINPCDSNFGCNTNNLSDINYQTIINDTSNWVKVSGTFLADSAYEYLAMGKFYDDAHTDTMQSFATHVTSINQAYYYIDNVCVAKDSGDCLITTNLPEKLISSSSINVFPNPFTNRLTIHSAHLNDGLFTLRDQLGDIVLSGELNDKTSIDVSFLKSGLYFLEAQFKDEVFRKKIIKLNE